MKKSLKILVVSILLLILFRGFVYRLLISYTAVGTRSDVKITNTDLIERIEREAANQEMNLENFVKIANVITTESLKFTFSRAPNNPNELIDSHLTNCIGYSAMFNSIVNYLIRKNKLQGNFVAKHKIGHLHFLGWNLHQFFDDPFFRDHDFNEIRDRKTGEIISIDPSVSDYFWIKKITVSEN